MDIADKNKMRRLGFLPQAKPIYNVKYSVLPNRLECITRCPDCHTEISFLIHGQTKRWSVEYIRRSITRALTVNHTRKCVGRLNRAKDNLNTFYADIRRGVQQSQERAYRVQRGQEPPQLGHS